MAIQSSLICRSPFHHIIYILPLSMFTLRNRREPFKALAIKPLSLSLAVYRQRDMCVESGKYVARILHSERYAEAVTHTCTGTTCTSETSVNSSGYM